MEFSGPRLYQKRLAADMSRADLATAVRQASGGKIKASEAGIRGWERDVHTPGGQAVMALASALGCRAEDLYGADDDAEAAEAVAAAAATNGQGPAVDLLDALRAVVRDELVRARA